MNKQSGRIGLYFVLIVMLVAGYFYLNNQVASQSSYSMESMKQAAEDGKLSSAKIYQNREVPTGSVVADIEGEGKKSSEFMQKTNRLEKMWILHRLRRQLPVLQGQILKTF